MKTNFLLYNHPDAVLIAFQGMAFTLMLIIFSGLSFTINGAFFAFTWIPLAAIFLWPRWSHSFLTPFLIAFCGLIADFMSARYLGLSSLLFLIFFWSIKPTEREVKIGLFKSWLEFSLSATLLLYVLFFIIGRVIDISVGWRNLFKQVVLMIALFPIIYGLRALIRHILINPDDVNYQ